MPVITQAFDSGDGVFIGGKHLHHNFQPMTNTELTLDQLQMMSGGVDENKLAKILKPKPKVKEVKLPKPFVYDLDSAVKMGASPGPFLPKPNYASQNFFPAF